MNIFILAQKVLYFFRKVFSFCFGRETCVACGRETLVLPLCKSCLKKHFMKVDFNFRCSVCGKPLVSEEKICMACRETPVICNCDRVLSLHTYRLWKKNLLFQWKICEKRVLSPVFAKLIDFVLKNQFNGQSFTLVPVPPRSGKKKLKGWDQIEELCSILKNCYGYKVLNILERLNVCEQKKLDRRERLETKGKAYGISKKWLCIPQNKIPDFCIIVDDVLTTGITVENCACCLKNFGVKRVEALTLFIVD